MSRRTFIAAGIAMVVLGTAVRLNNALQHPLMFSYDGFAHFTYIWFLAATGRIPAATAGWEFFQPPAYYALMLAFWKGLPSTDALLRLRLGTACVALLGLAPAFVSFRIVRRYFPGNRLIHLLAPGLMLFLPVHLYSAGFLGNEGFGAALCSLGLLALLRTLQRETFLRAALLGLILGVAMLAKFTALAVVAAAFATLGLRALRQRTLMSTARTLPVVAAVMFAVCGWFYMRNLIMYGNPFQMSRKQLFLAHVENSHPQGRRTFLEYVLFDPVILYHPQWPRGQPLIAGRPPGSDYSALRASVPTGFYANTWFDGFGGFVLPPITSSAPARWSGRALMTLGMIPTLLMILGVWTGIGDLRRKGWNDTLVTMLLTSAAMATIVIQGTRSVPTQAAVKATYLMPVSVVFSFWFALGIDRLSKSGPSLLRPVTALCTLLAVLSTAVFTHGLFIDNDWMTTAGGGPAFRNLHGIVYFAAGDREHARQLFKWAARDKWPLALENLAALALQDGQPREALDLLDEASRIKRVNLATAAGVDRLYVQQTLAEYANTRAVIRYQLGEYDAALAAVRESRDLDPSIPETLYNLGVLKLIDALAHNEGARRATLVEEARHNFEASSHIDPAFYEALAMQGVTETLAGDCAAGIAMIREALAPHPGVFRAYPLETGPGDLHAAGIHRRRRIEHLPAELDPVTRLNACVDVGA